MGFKSVSPAGENELSKPSSLTTQQRLHSLKEDDNKDGEDDDDNKDGEDDDDDDDDDDDKSDSTDDDKHVEMEIFTQEEIIQKMPIIFLLYEFYFVNQYWYYANLWHTILGYLSVLRIILLILETCNGPNNFEGRENKADYRFLPNKALYWTFQMVCTIPMCIDTSLVLITLSLIFFRKRLSLLFDNLKHNYFELFVVFCDTVCLIPFIITVFNPNIELVWTTVFRLLTLLVFGHLLRCSKVSPFFFAVRTALVRAGPRLLLPVFFFFCLNIVISVILYYIEPCYNVDICGGQWKDLLDASFYSLVTMCTVGYGNQIAQYFSGRFLAVLLMIFGGAVFISLPLVIIGGEYDEAIALLDTFESEKETQEKKHLKLRMQAFKLLGLSGFCNSSFMTSTANNRSSSKNMTTVAKKATISNDRMAKLLSGKVHRFDKSNSAIFKCHKNIRAVLKLAENESKECRHLSPLLLLCLSDLRSWIAILISHMDIAMEILDIEADVSSQVMGRSLKALVQNGVVVTSRDDNTKEGRQQKAVYDESNSSISQYLYKALVRPLLVSFGVSHLVDQSANKISVDEKKDDILHYINSNDSMDHTERDHVNHLDTLKHMNDKNKKDENNPNKKNKDKKQKHLEKILEATMNDKSWKNRLWLLIEVPESSWLARAFQLIIMICIILSIMVLYTQSITSYSNYGEATTTCLKTVQFYCQDKLDPALDPGCFVTEMETGATQFKLNYNCKDASCYGQGFNFGSPISNVTCVENLELDQPSRPFQTKSALDSMYGELTMITTRSQKHLQSDICRRIECINNEGVENINLLWFGSELVLTIIFTLECFARFFVSDSITEYFLSHQNILDIISVLPFYFELVISIFSKNSLVGNYGILASYVDNSILGLRSVKVIRLFKFGRHFLSTQVLIETVFKVFSQLLGCIFLLVSFSWLFSAILYELEKGTKCYVGDNDCDASGPIDGQMVFTNIKGNPSGFSNFFYSLWFSFVTLTSTGYGEIVPVTLAGQIITVAGMFLGQCWMTLPMTATGSTYYKLYNKFFNKLLQLEKLEKTKEDEIHTFLPREQARLTLFYKQLKNGEDRLFRLMKYLKRPFKNTDNDDDDDDDDNDNNKNKNEKSIIVKEFISIISYLSKLFGAEDSVQAQDLSRLGEASMETHLQLFDDIKAGKV